MKIKNYIWIAAAMLIAGCAAAPVMIEKQEVVAPAVKAAEETPATRERAPRMPDDRELLLDGVRLLGLPGRQETAKARLAFIAVIQQHPQGRWRPVAEAFIRLIDERETLQEAGRLDRLMAEAARDEKGRVLKEDEVLRQTVRQLTEKMERLQAETLLLAKDNEQLKQDIRRLKALEIELEKRERTLR